VTPDPEVKDAGADDMVQLAGLLGTFGEPGQPAGDAQVVAESVRPLPR
jgi:hypothetical protein